MSILGRDEQRCGSTRQLGINVTASFNQLLRRGSMPFLRRDVDRRGTILRLNVNVAASFKQVLDDRRMPIVAAMQSGVYPTFC